MARKQSVLFVCSGNICRSPYAEAYLVHRLNQEGLSNHVNVESAGTHGYHTGEAPDRRGRAAALRRGINMDHLRARPVRPHDMEEFSLLIAMADEHYSALMRAARGDEKQKIYYFSDFTPDLGVKSIPDPYYGGDSDFEYMMDLIEKGTEGIINHIKNEINSQ